PADPVGRTFRGNAYWRVRMEASGPAAKEEAALRLDVDVPERELVFSVVLRRDGAVMSHLVEFRFARSSKLPIDGVSDVLGILMKDNERAGGMKLVGHVTKVTPGVFLYGLDGEEANASRNLQLFRQRPWLDVPIVYKNGS